LKTFLEVARTRHFRKTADNLFLTQSAVSARIKLLEETIGTPLFHRGRNNIQLTPAGQKLLRHAESMVNLWNRARQQVIIPDDIEVSLAVAGVPSLWDIFLQAWFEDVCRSKENIMLQVDVRDTEVQIRMLCDGTLDLGFMFEIPHVSGLVFKEVARIPLIMVTSDSDTDAERAIKENYVLVDWGTSFATTHANHFFEAPPPTLRVGLGRIAHSLLRRIGGSAYLAEPMVRDDIQSKALFLVADAPVIERKAYAVYAESNERKNIMETLLSEHSHDAYVARSPDAEVAEILGTVDKRIADDK